MLGGVSAGHWANKWGRSVLPCQSTTCEGCWVESQVDTGPINGEGWYNSVNLLCVRDAGRGLNWTLGQ